MEAPYEIVSPVRPTGRLTKWKPKKWRPEYDRIVAYSVMGKSNVWIAKELGFTPVHVSNILNDERAVAFADKLHAKLRQSAEADIPLALNRIAEKTVKLLERVFDDEEIVQKSPFAVIDRGIDVLKGLNHLKTGAQAQGNTTINNNTVVLNNHQKDAISSGLDKLKQIAEIHYADKSGTTSSEK